MVEKLEKIAERKGITPTQLTLAWEIQQWEGFYPIPGSTRVEGVKEAMDALKVKFEAKEQEELRQIIDSADIKGLRYNEHAEGSLFG